MKTQNRKNRKDFYDEVIEEMLGYIIPAWWAFFFLGVASGVFLYGMLPVGDSFLQVGMLFVLGAFILIIHIVRKWKKETE